MPSQFSGNGDRKRQPSKAGYRDWQQRRTQKGNYFPVFRDIAAALGPHTTILALHLANVGQNRCDEGGWIMAKSVFVCQGTGLKAPAQEKAFARLKRLGIVEVQMRGSERWVRLDLDALDKAVAKAPNSPWNR